MPPPITAVRHLKIWVSDLAASSAWYERVFGLVHETDFPEPDGTVLGSQFFFPGSQLRLAIRQDPDRARALHDADPFALALTREELDQWMEHLDALGIWHPPVIETPRGWATGFRDPDGMQIRLYADKQRQQRGHRREGVTLAEATDILRTCASDELYDLLVVQRGWSLPRFARFPADYMIAALLAPAH